MRTLIACRVGTATPRHEIAWFRRGILGKLASRGTASALGALSRIRDEVMDQMAFAHAESQARELFLRETWPKMSPQDLLRLAQRADSRIVQSAEHLLDVVIESLERFQQRLQGEIPLSEQMVELKPNPKRKSAGQDKRKRPKSAHQHKRLFRPRDELRLANLVANYLLDKLSPRGVIVNREVAIRLGERTDIHLNVPAESGRTDVEPGGLIIEVKGCWHDEVDSALKEQLVERYLKDNPNRAGLYLVIWFSTENWDPSDHRRSNVPRRSVEESRSFYKKQAEAEAQRTGRLVASCVLDATLR